MAVARTMVRPKRGAERYLSHAPPGIGPAKRGSRAEVVKNLKSLEKKGVPLSPRGERTLAQLGPLAEEAKTLRKLDKTNKLTARGKRRLAELKTCGF